MRSLPQASRPAPSAETSQPPRSHRVLIAALVGILGVVLRYVVDTAPGTVADLDVVLYAGRDLLADRNPYPLVGPSRDLHFYYPLTAPVALLPLAILPVELGRWLFVGISSALLAYAVAGENRHRLPLFFSAAYAQCALQGQWPPLLMAAALLPGLAWLYVAKPHTGLILLAAYTSRTALRATVAGAFVLGGIAFVLQPSWPRGWVATMGDATHFKAPVMYAGGLLLLLAVLRWRRPEARLLLALALVPRTSAVYETLLVFLVPRSVRESWFMVGASWALLVIHGRVLHGVAGAGPEAFARLELATLVTIYLPALFMTLRRPNEGRVPQPLEAVVRRMRGWRQREHPRFSGPAAGHPPADHLP